jgi:hypothetical protein
MTAMSKPMIEREKASRRRRTAANSLRSRSSRDEVGGGAGAAASSCDRVSAWTWKDCFSRTTLVVDDFVSVVELRRLVAMVGGGGRLYHWGSLVCF